VRGAVAPGLRCTQDMAARARAFRVVLLALTLLSVAGSSFAQPPKVGVVTAVYGTATVSRASATLPLALRFRDDVFVQDRIVTREQSYARILLGGAAVVTVRERSVVTITDAPQRSSIYVGDGGIALSVARELMRPGQAIEIRTPNASAGIRGTVIVTEVGGGSTRFTLLTGKVDIHAGSVAVPLLPSQAISIVGAAAPGPIQRVTPDEAAGIARRFEIPLATPPGRGSEWVASEQVRRAAILTRQSRDQRSERPRDDNGGRRHGGDTDEEDAGVRGHRSALSAPSKSGSATSSSPIAVDSAPLGGKRGKTRD
jgi:hypothetical protein